jgi:hypothetical protein
MNSFNDALQQMMEICTIKDPEYWDIKLLDGETSIASDDNTLKLCTKENVVITIKLHYLVPYNCYFTGHVTLPPTLYHLVNVNNINVDLKFTHFQPMKSTYGWSHAHDNDAHLLLPLSIQPNKHVSGPVQVLNEARCVIKAMMETMMEKKREEMDLIGEELMMKTCHPKRIAVWIEHGFDPFE